jgi:hypothetical protein
LGRVGPHVVHVLAKALVQLQRMSLAEPRTRQEWIWQRLLVRELRTLTAG